MARVKKRCLRNSNSASNVIHVGSDDKSTSKKMKLVNIFAPKPNKSRMSEVEVINLIGSPPQEPPAIDQFKVPPTTAKPFKFALDDVDFAPFPAYGSLTFENKAVTEPEWKVSFREGPIACAPSSSKWSDLSFGEEPNQHQEFIEFSQIKRKGQNLEPLPWAQQVDVLDCPLWEDEAHLIQARKILSRWRKRLDKEQAKPLLESKTKKKKKPRLSQITEDDEDVYDSDEEYDPDHDEHNSIENPVIFYGSSTSKEQILYRLAESLHFKVLELHTGDKRDGDTLRKRIEAAATSHRVRLTEKTLSNFFTQKTKCSIDKNEANDEREHTLIFISNIDITFQSDYDFITSLNGILEDVRVPVFLTCDKEITSGPLFELSNVLQVQIPVIDKDNCSRVLQRFASSSNYKLSQPGANRISEFFNGNLCKSSNWLQFACASKEKVALPANFSSKYEDSFSTHLRGVDQELNPSFVYRDQLEEAFEKRMLYPEIFEVLKPINRGETRENLIPEFTKALDFVDGKKSLCTDVIPLLQVMNIAHRSKVTGRRALHYFSQVQTNEPHVAIDRNGRLLPLLSEFHEKVSLP